MSQLLSSQPSRIREYLCSQSVSGRANSSSYSCKVLKHNMTDILSLVMLCAFSSHNYRLFQASLLKTAAQEDHQTLCPCAEESGSLCVYIYVYIIFILFFLLVCFVNLCCFMKSFRQDFASYFSPLPWFSLQWPQAAL